MIDLTSIKVEHIIIFFILFALLSLLLKATKQILLIFIFLAVVALAVRYYIKTDVSTKLLELKEQNILDDLNKSINNNVDEIVEEMQ